MGHMRSVVKVRYEAEDEEDPDDWCDGGSSSELGFKEVAIAALMPGRVSPVLFPLGNALKPPGQVQQVFVNVVLATDTEDLELSVTGQKYVAEATVRSLTVCLHACILSFLAQPCPALWALHPRRRYRLCL